MGVVHRFWVRRIFNFKRVALTSGFPDSVYEVCGKLVASKLQKREIK
jgi:hypothetical protein